MGFFSSRTLRIHDTSLERYDSLTSEEVLAVVQSHPPSPPPPATPPHLPREKKMRLRERECCTSIEAWEDGDKRYPGNDVDLEHDDYDVMCLDKMQHEKLLFYISLSFCFWVRSRFCFVFLVWGFEFPFRDYLSVSSFGFSILLVCFFFRVLHVYFRVLSACFALRASRKTFSFLHCIILFCILWFWF